MSLFKTNAKKNLPKSHKEKEKAEFAEYFVFLCSIFLDAPSINSSSINSSGINPCF